MTKTYAQEYLAGVVGPAFYTWQVGGTAYEVQPYGAASLAPFEGYWVYAYKPCTLIFPAQPMP